MPAAAGHRDATFSTTAATNRTTAATRISPEAFGPGRPVTMLAIATTMQEAASRASTTAITRIVVLY